MEPLRPTDEILSSLAAQMGLLALINEPTVPEEDDQSDSSSSKTYNQLT